MTVSVDMYNAQHRVIIQNLLNNEVSEREYDLFMRKMKTTRMSTNATTQKLTGVIPTDNLRRCVNLYTNNALLQRMTVPNITFVEFCDPYALYGICEHDMHDGSSDDSDDSDDSVD